MIEAKTKIRNGCEGSADCRHGHRIGSAVLTHGKMQVKKGDEVLFGSYAGTEITVDGKEMLIMSEDDILAVVT